MKKTLLLIASAAFLLVGCAKEQLSNGVDGGMTNVTFTASVDGGVATKAVADGDGQGTKVNRCIMEIYFQNQLYTRLEQPVTNKVATFANVPVVAGKQYQVLFWADCGKTGNTGNTGNTDKYYDTDTTATIYNGNKGLKAVTIIHNEFITALESKKNDELDAFFSADNYTVPQTGGNFNAKLKRPFAQLNVITTDVAKGKTVTSADLLPEKVFVSYDAATTFNVADSTITGTATYSYKAPVYGSTTDWSDVKTRGEFTLSMDYILASKEQRLVNLTFKTLKGENVETDAVMTHNLNNLPFQRNYRTNVKGDLLTTSGTWKSTIDPIWGMNGDGGVITHKIASSYTDVVSALQSGNDSKNMKVTVTPAAVNNLSDAEKAQVIVSETIGDQSVKALKFVLYEEKTGEDAHPASPVHVEFELPKRPAGVDAWKIEHEPSYPTETVVVSTKEEENANVIIDAPNSTVTLDATKINSVVSTTSENTLIIPQGLELINLEVKKGSVEYHGTGLTKVSVSSNGTFKTSEGLANTDDVYGVVKDHVAEGFAITKESENTWKIVPEVCKIGETGYGSLADAFNSINSNVETTVTVIADANETFESTGATIKKERKVVLDLNGHKLVGTSTASGYTKYIYVENGGELTVKDSQTGGAIEYHDGYIENLTSGSSTGGSAIISHGMMTLESGTIENKTPDTKTNDLEGAIDIYTNAWDQAYSPADIVLNIKGGVVKSNSSCTIRMTSFSAGSYTTSVTANMNGGEVYGRNGFFIQGVSEGNLNTNTLNLNGGKVYGIEAVRVMAFQDHANASETKPVTIKIGEGVDMKSNYPTPSTRTGWSEGICIHNITGSFEQLLSYVDIKKVVYATTLLRGSEVFGKYETIADAVWAFNYDPAITAGDYTLNIKPGIYNEDMILFIQDKTEEKYRTLTVQSADSNEKVIVKSSNDHRVVFGIAAESDYSGGPIYFKNVDIDISENTNSQAYPVYFAGSQSGTPDLIFPEPSTNYNRRYGHNVSFDNCNIIGNGTSQAFVGSTGTGAIKVENCSITNCAYGFAGYYVFNPGHTTFGLHINYVTFNGGTFINDESAGNTEIVVDNCVLNSNSDYVIRTSGSYLILDKCDYQFVIKDTEINVDGAYMGDSRGVIYFRSKETHALIDNCTVTKKNLTRKDDTCILYDIYNKDTTVTINGKNLPSGSLVNMEWLTEN